MNKKDEKGRKQGYWEEHFGTSKGYYLNDKKHGYWEENINNNFWVKLTYHHGLKFGISRCYGYFGGDIGFYISTKKHYNVLISDSNIRNITYRVVYNHNRGVLNSILYHKGNNELIHREVIFDY